MSATIRVASLTWDRHHHSPTSPKTCSMPRPSPPATPTAHADKTSPAGDAFCDSSRGTTSTRQPSFDPEVDLDGLTPQNRWATR